MEQTPISPEPIPQTSAFSKIINIFSEPSNVFEEVIHQDKTLANWLFPTLFFSIAVICFTIFVFSDARIQYEMRENQIKSLEEKVHKGEMTQEQYERTLEHIPLPGSVVFLITGSIGGTLYVFASMFLVALAIFLIGKTIWNINLSYSKLMEIVALSHAVFILDTIVSIFVIRLSGSMYKTFSPAFFIESFDTTNVFHQAMKSLDIFSFWYLFLMFIGVSKYSGKSVSTIALFFIPLWLAYQVIAILFAV